MKIQRIDKAAACADAAIGEAIAADSDGLAIQYSPINQAYLVMWHSQLLRIFNTKAEAEDEVAYYRS